MSELYYRNKIISLSEKLFIETGDSRSRIINCEEQIFSAQLASNTEDVPQEIRDRWTEIWEDFNKKKEMFDGKSRLIQSSLSSTITSKRNKSLKNFLLFVLKEFHRVL